jgi:transposase
LYRYQGTVTHEDAIYRFLDTLNTKYKTEVERIAFKHTQKILGKITVVFYDMTTLYFETEDEDDLRKIGFSKDGKFQCPQIMVGLLVGEGGYPIGYDVFEGNTFEGKTLVPVLEKIAGKYKLGKPVVVADAAMLSKKNIEELQRNKYTFIVGGRIKNESEKVKGEILMKSSKKDGDSCEVIRDDGTRIIVTYKEKRAKKDAHNRNKGLKKLRAKIETGRLTKTNITNRGYNKFLALEGEIKVTIDEEKIKADEIWDGLKGYVTNTKLTHAKIIEHYGHLWQIEKAFRISKTDLRIRPIYHYKRSRIEAHLTIAFTAYSIWKKLESLLTKSGVIMSPKRAGELTHTMYAVDYELPQSKKMRREILKMDTEQASLYDVIHRK